MEKGMYIRKADKNDLPRMLEIYETARAFMAEHGNPDQWGSTGYPQEEVLLNDIRAGQSYVCIDEDGHITGTFCFLTEQDGSPSSDDFTEGRWLSDAPYGILHRLASDKKGTGSFCLDWAEKQCPHLRVYTHTANCPMHSLLVKKGFVQCGILHVRRDPFPRAAYEKLPDPDRNKKQDPDPVSEPADSV